MSTEYDYNKYRQRYNERHPDKQRQWRLNSAANMLRKAGYVVYAPCEQVDSNRITAGTEGKEVFSR